MTPYDTQHRTKQESVEVKFGSEIENSTKLLRASMRLNERLIKIDYSKSYSNPV